MIRKVLFCFFLFLMSCNKKECVAPEDKPSVITYGSTTPSSNSTTTISLQNSASTSDAYLAEFYPNNNYGLNTKLFCSAWTYSGTPAKVLYLIRFDYSNVPEGKTIISAKLSLYADTTNVYTGSPAPDKGHYGANLNWSIKRIENLWSESIVTFNNRPTSSIVNQVKLNTPLNNTSSFIDINVTDLVKDQLHTQNYGFEISLDDAIPYKRLAFYSSDSPYLNSIPVIRIEYK